MGHWANRYIITVTSVLGLQCNSKLILLNIIRCSDFQQETLGKTYQKGKKRPKEIGVYVAPPPLKKKITCPVGQKGLSRKVLER